MQNEVQCVVPCGDICGEGAVWHPQQHRLYWTDINRFLVHQFDPGTQVVQTWLFDEPVTSVNLTTRPDTLLLVFASKIGLWSPQQHPRIETIYRLAAAPAMRFNDARVDPRGSLWVGTMRNNVGPCGEELDVTFSGGVLYRIDPNGTATEWKNGIGISNTVAWSPDRKTFYFGDTTANVIYAFDYDDQTGVVSAERPFFARDDYGMPDGSAVDADGFLWNARFYAGCVIRIAPSGQIDRIVSLPVSKPTTCAFGGPDLKTLYITSARSNEQLSGSIYALELSVGGLPDSQFSCTRL